MDERLRGRPDELVTRVPTKTPNYGPREDGTPKGVGYFGEISRTDEPDYISTELSISIGPNKKDLIPLLVPSLTAEEIAHLVDGGQPTKDIVRKAIRHAEQRQAEGKSPYAEPGEIYALPSSANQQMKKGYDE